MGNQHSIVKTLFSLKGNQKACVYTEPLWGIPYNLYMPFASLYMVAMGVTDSQIGLIASIGLVFQIFFSLLSGVITDKLGRKRTTLIFDILSWSVPCLIWAIAQSFIYFAIAAMVNSMWRVTMNSWTCLLAEDCEQDQLVDIYSWIHIANLIAAFFAPLAGLFIGWYELVPTVRVLYLISFVMMTSKFIILNVFATETKQGKIRMEETRDQSMIEVFSQYREILKQILKAPQTLITLGIMLVMNIATMINGMFWPLLITDRIGIPIENVGTFHFLRSAVMLILYFSILPRIQGRNFINPMGFGFLLFFVSHLLLIISPEHMYVLVILSVVLEAFCLATINPLLDSMIIITVDPKERARIMALLYVIVITLTSPFGWLAGNLSEINRILPFILNMGLFVIGTLLAYLSSISARRTAMPTIDA